MWTTEKMLHDNKDKIKEEDKKDIEGKIMELKNALKDGEAGKIRTAGDALTEAAQKVGAAMYAQENKKTGEPETQTAQEAKPEEKAEEKKE